MAEPRVTVIIPCFNDGPLAEEAVASVVEDEPVRIIVVDDGSDDEPTARAMERLQAGGLAEVLQRGNGGLSAARLSGLEQCRTRYLFTLDADDHLTPGALGALADLLDADPTAAFAFGDYESFGDHCGRWVAPPFSPWLAMHANWWGPSALFRCDELRRAGAWSLQGGYEDWDLWLAFAEAGARGIKVPRVVWRRRLHGARMQGACRTNHMSRYRLLRRRHAALYAQRRDYARTERIGHLRRIAYPLFLAGRPLMPARLEAVLLPVWWRIGRLRTRGGR